MHAVRTRGELGARVARGAGVAFALCTGGLLAWAVTAERTVERAVLPDGERAHVIGQHLIRNVYRAAAYDRESDLYDVLARTVEGDYLDRLYAQLKRAGTDVAGGKARSEILGVDVLESRLWAPPDRMAGAATFDLMCRWRVEGLVRHEDHVVSVGGEKMRVIPAEAGRCARDQCGSFHRSSRPFSAPLRVLCG